MQEEIIKLYRAESSDGFHFDLEANNKKEVEKEIENKGFDVKNWGITRIN